MNHPGINHIGQVIDDGETVTVTGWGLGLCAAACGCHRGSDGLLHIDADQYTGSLGLRRYRTCTCCTAWTVDELAAIVADVAGMRVA